MNRRDLLKLLGFGVPAAVVVAKAPAAPVLEINNDYSDESVWDDDEDPDEFIGPRFDEAEVVARELELCRYKVEELFARDDVFFSRIK